MKQHRCLRACLVPVAALLAAAVMSTAVFAALPEGAQVLNLFGYTGVASLVAAKAGCQVVHVDASKKAIEQASGKAWGLRAARLYDALDADLVKKMNEAGQKKTHTLSVAEKKKFVREVKAMETEWAEKAAKEGLPARELLTALHRSAAKNRPK